MKNIKTIIIFLCVLCVVYFSSSCERDDICSEDTPTTPLLIIKFIDNVTGINSKAPNELLIKPIDTTITDSIYFISNVDSIAIPLRTDASITDYEFIINADTTDEGNEIINRDTISFQYTLQEEYLNSACGFRATFTGLTTTPPDEPDDANWIKVVTIQRDRENIIDETAAHILIFH